MWPGCRVSGRFGVTAHRSGPQPDGVKGQSMREGEHRGGADNSREGKDEESTGKEGEDVSQLGPAVVPPLE